MFTRASTSTGPASPRVHGFHDKASGSIQYVAIDEATRACALIDVVQDFDPEAARTRFDSAGGILEFVAREGLTVAWVLDTHPHADHLMASAWLREQTGAPNAIGRKVLDIADLWRGYYNTPDAFDPETDFARLFADGDTFALGDLEVRVMLSPGHTMGSITYVIGDAVFAHDTFMHVDVGSSRADFPGGSAAELYDSMMAILGLPDASRIFVGHDYGTDTRSDPAWEATVGAHRRDNPHVGGGRSKAEFVALREERDATLPLPDRMLAALQVNLRAGRLPEPEADGHRYLRIPANRF